MKRLAWLTDIHLNFLDSRGVDRFCKKISVVDPDLLLVGGDTGEADSVFEYLKLLAKCLQKPVYFVFGNHDYYKGSISEVRETARTTVGKDTNLFWLVTEGVVRLTATTALIGHGGWGDGRLGDYRQSSVKLNDFYQIGELRNLNSEDRLAKLRLLGDEAAEYLYRTASHALKQFQKLIVLTHVPPFKEACLYRNQIGGDDWLPFFTCAAAGDILRKLMLHNPEKQMTVLCGHSHHAAKVSILPNLLVQTGAAEYGSPVIQDLILTD